MTRRGFYLAFLYYYFSEWGDEEFRTLAHMADYFDIDIRLAMYYLKRMVKQGLLCQVRIKRNTYYVKAWTADVFAQVPYVKLIRPSRRMKQYDSRL